MPTDLKPVLILGAGINGCAIARELVLNHVPVYVVDTADICSGTTPYSSRLIHGGLRYLEYGEFDLVRESLAERTRLLKLAPQYVRPLQLFIPVANRFGGMMVSLRRFFGRESPGPAQARGQWLVRAGLWFYDTYARDKTLPKRAVHRIDDPAVTQVDRRRYRWLCSYYDAQIAYPERFVLAMLEDARRIAETDGVEFRVFTYHRTELSGRTVNIEPVRNSGGTNTDGPSPAGEQHHLSFEPSAIVNATGAWVDLTLEKMPFDSKRLMGGTKGSHFITRNGPLRERLAGRGIYAEATDGRPVFVLPLCDATLIGTTDVPFDGRPEEALASEEELDYLLDSASAILGDIRLTRDDVDMHYCGVRPLPYVDAATPGAITRRHWLEENTAAPLPFYSVIGGKLTTCRSLAEQGAAIVLGRLDRQVTTTSRERPFPGGEGYPQNEAAEQREVERIAQSTGLTREQVAGIWRLYGTRTAEILANLTVRTDEAVAGTSFPVDFVRWVIQHEWVQTLPDLVERRLLLLYDAHVNETTLFALARLLVDAGRLAPDEVDAAVEHAIERLKTRYGKRVVRDSAGGPGSGNG